MTELDKTWDKLRNRLISYVRSKVEVDVSEDLVHDILLRVLKNEEKLSKADNPLAWIYTVARNRITDYYRKQSKIEFTDNLDSLGPESFNTGILIENFDNEFAKCLRPVLERIEPKYKEAILLSDFNEVKQGDAAEQLGISLSGMKSRIQRGRIKLKKELLACCAIEKDRFGIVIDYKQKESCNNHK